MKQKKQFMNISSSYKSRDSTVVHAVIKIWTQFG